MELEFIEERPIWVFREKIETLEQRSDCDGDLCNEIEMGGVRVWWMLI